MFSYKIVLYIYAYVRYLKRNIYNVWMQENFGHILVALDTSPRKSILPYNFLRRAKYKDNSTNKPFLCVSNDRDFKNRKIFVPLWATVTLSLLSCLLWRSRPNAYYQVKILVSYAHWGVTNLNAPWTIAHFHLYFAKIYICIITENSKRIYLISHFCKFEPTFFWQLALFALLQATIGLFAVAILPFVVKKKPLYTQFGQYICKYANLEGPSLLMFVFKKSP